MGRVKQCIAWDGKRIAIVEKESTGDNARIYSDRHVRSGELSVADIDGGDYGQVVMAALSTPKDIRNIERMLEQLTLREFIVFYSQATRIGMVASDFRLQFMAVLKNPPTPAYVGNPPAPRLYPEFGELYAMAIVVESDRMSIHYSQQYNCLAIGQDAYAAMLLMRDGRTATQAVTAQTILSSDEAHYHIRRHGVSYDDETGHYSYTSFMDTKEEDSQLPFFRADMAPRTQKQIDDDYD